RSRVAWSVIRGGFSMFQSARKRRTSTEQSQAKPARSPKPRVAQKSSNGSGFDFSLGPTSERESGPEMPTEIRELVEHSTGLGLSHVRVHDSAESHAAAAAIGADAYALGPDLHFAAGRYRPGTHDGDRLLVHEAIHALQYPTRPTLPPRAINTPEDASERD